MSSQPLSRVEIPQVTPHNICERGAVWHWFKHRRCALARVRQLGKANDLNKPNWFTASVIGKDQIGLAMLQFDDTTLTCERNRAIFFCAMQ